LSLNTAGTTTDRVEQIVVTGSRLRNTEPTAHVIVITREEISKRGLSTAADIVRSLPQNLSSVNASSTTTAAGEADTPMGTLGVTTANLRGLGSDATLVLVNGRRIASSPSFDGHGEINLGTIPAAAIERVEVVLDGASAIYGSDAIGGVINFIMVKDFQGSTTKARYESGANGGDLWSVTQSLGSGWGSGHVMLTGEYRDLQGVDAFKAGWTTSDLRSRGGSDRRATFAGAPARIFDLNGALPASFNGTENWTAADVTRANRVPFDIAAARGSDGSAKGTLGSLTLSLEQQLGSRVTGFMDALYSRSKNHAEVGPTFALLNVPASNPFNRLGTDLFVGYFFTHNTGVSESQIERLNVSTGVDIQLPFRDWKVNFTGSYGIEKSQAHATVIDPAVADTANIFGNGTAEGDLSPFLQVESGDDPKSVARTLDVFTDGSVFALPGGDAKLGIGLQVRPESLDLRGAPTNRLITQPVSDVLKLDGRAAFFEASVPLVGSGNSMPAVQSLRLSLAGRYDEYEFKGRFHGPALPEETRKFSKFNPRVGLLWNPVQQIAVRASWGRSFKAPALLTLGRGFEVIPDFTVDVRDPVTGNIVQVPFARGGNPDLKPETADIWSGGLQWNPLFVQGLSVGVSFSAIDWTNRVEVEAADDPSIWPFLDRLPSLIPRDLPVAAGGDGDPTTIDAGANVAVNLAKRTVHVLDFDVRQVIDTRLGAFNAQAAVTKTLKGFDRVLPGTPIVEQVETERGPDRLVWGAGLGWDRGHYGANLFAHYSSSYRNTLSQVQSRVDSYSTIDLTGFYQTDNGLRVNAGVLDLTDSSFPFIDSLRGSYDPSRVDPRGRTAFIELSKSFGKR
jgi:outer membrane receptor protein involved in Fe transport